MKLNDLLNLDAQRWAKDFIRAAGTSEGAEKAWDTRGRGTQTEPTGPAQWGIKESKKKAPTITDLQKSANDYYEKMQDKGVLPWSNQWIYGPKAPNGVGRGKRENTDWDSDRKIPAGPPKKKEPLPWEYQTPAQHHDAYMRQYNQDLWDSHYKSDVKSAGVWAARYVRSLRYPLEFVQGRKKGD
jgi:hypothetical protein